MKKILPTTQCEVAKAAGVTQSFISAILKKKRTASPDVAARLEAATGIDYAFWRDPSRFDTHGNRIEAPRQETPHDPALP